MAAAKSDPKIVPTKSIDTTSDCISADMVYPVGLLTRSSVGEPNVLNQSFIPCIPLMTPLSYPNRMPPKAKKTSIKKVRILFCNDVRYNKL